MKKKITELLDQKINEVFLAIQEEENITDGFIEPLDAIELDELTEKMATLIAKVIAYEKEVV